ncbi:MAG: hypothetical protein KKH12_03070 [Gammaproteobacteria bacterium]|nr:hypothetical protein [Gammaproteobacteria bacterium]MBU1480636.1 hypothetical protein [Gammaproteobacteria bacterium]
MNRSRRRLLQQLSTLGLLSGMGIPGLIRSALAAGNYAGVQGMHKIKGEVRINGILARKGQPVLPGDKVTTGADGEAIYVMDRNAFLQRSDSVVQFGKEATKEFFRVVSGRILSVFGPGKKRLVVPTAVIGIRGTACYIEAEPENVYFCLCYGTAEIEPNAEPGRVVRIETRHHDHPVNIHRDKGMPSMANAKVINHTDDELIMLEWLNRRRPPFYGQGLTGYY